MALGGVAERLAILITANGSAAVSEFGRVGAAAETKMGAATTSTGKLSSALSSAGISATVFGAVAAAGLYHAAQQAAESQLAIDKLNLAFANSPVLAGQSTDALVDQANALQDVTVYSDEATINMDAMLATFRLTSDQIQQLAPLTQDLASFWGVDLSSAAKAVGKAMMGNIGALQRQGIIIDQDAYATDRFSAVMSALRENAGGFAEEEGASLAGQLEIAKNKFNEVEEAVGRGVLPVFSEFAQIVTDDVIPAVQTLADGLDALSPGSGGSGFLHDLVTGSLPHQIHAFGDAFHDAETATGRYVQVSKTLETGGDDPLKGRTIDAAILADTMDELASEARQADNAIAGLDNSLGRFDAVTAAQEAAQQFNETLHDQERTTLDVRGAMSRLISAQEDLAVANHTSRAGTLDAAGANRELRGRLADVASFIPSNLLPQFRAATRGLGDISGAAGRIPHNIDIHVTAVVQDAINNLNAIAARASAVANLTNIAASVSTHAHGGFIRPGESGMISHGGEMVSVGPSGTVAVTPRAGVQGGGGTVELGRSTIRALARELALVGGGDVNVTVRDNG